MALKIGKQNIRKLFKTGGDATYGITLPIEAIRKFGWQQFQKLEIEIDEKNKKIIIKDWKK